MQVEIVTLSRQGGRDYNEDCVDHRQDDRYVGCLVADGAGGHGGGDVAAQTVRDTVLTRFAAEAQLTEAFLRQIVEQANEQIVALQAQGGRLAQMRSTVVFAAIDLQAQAMMWVHSGDSRAYLFRGGAIVARTCDHSLVQQMVASGMLGDEGARLHPQRNVLLSALGTTDAGLEITVSDRMRLEPGDALLLCSDGVWEVLGDEGLIAALHQAGSPSQWSRHIEDAIVQHGKPEQDNYSALLLWAHDQDDQKTRFL